MHTKTIQAGQTHIDLYKADLVPPQEQKRAAVEAKTDGREECPWRVFLGHGWEGHSFEELVILTPEAPKRAAGRVVDEGKRRLGEK